MLSKRLFCAARAAMTRIPLAPHRAALSSTPNQPPLPRGDDERNLSNQAVVDSANVGYRAKLTNLWKKYGLLAVGTYFGIYFTTLGSLFLSLDYNLINPSTLGIDHTAAIHKICELVEDFTGITSLPNYIREHPQGEYCERRLLLPTIDVVSYRLPSFSLRLSVLQWVPSL